jgi:hypothetical protein
MFLSEVGSFSTRTKRFLELRNLIEMQVTPRLEVTDCALIVQRSRHALDIVPRFIQMAVR